MARVRQRTGTVLGGAAGRIRNRLRSVGRQVLAIAKTARRGDDVARPRIYRRLMAHTRAVLRAADTMVRIATGSGWAKALDDHVRHFGRAPDLATADRGYNSAANEALATARVVWRVVLPKLGAKSPARRAHEQQRWFRRGMLAAQFAWSVEGEPPCPAVERLATGEPVWLAISPHQSDTRLREERRCPESTSRSRSGTSGRRTPIASVLTAA